MKKTVRILAVALCVIVLALSLTACAIPKSDPDEAKAALEANGYTVVKTNGYISGVVSAILGKESTISATVTGTKTVEDSNGDSKTEYITIVYFKTEDAAKAAWNDMQEDSDDAKEDYGESDWVFQRSGKMIYYGTTNAVRSAS